MTLLDNLQGYWKFDESSGDASDSSPNARTLTNTNTVGFAAAKINNGADYGTSNGTDKTFIRNDACGLTGTGSVSASFWLKARTEIAASSVVIWTNQANGGIYHQLSYEFNGGTRRLRWDIGGTATLYNITLGTANFYHVVVTKTTTTATEIFVNASSVSTGSPGSGTAGSTYNAFGASSGASNGMAMFLDEVGIWDRVITGAEITSLYNTGTGIQYPFGISTANALMFGHAF